MQEQSHSANDGEEVAAGGILPPGTEATREERLRALLEEAEREKAQFKALAQRAQADLINYRKRAEEERRELVGATSSQVILRVLPALDDVERALAQAPDAASETASRWIEGFRLIERKLQTILAAEGLQRIEAEGADFNPFEHEVVGHLQAEGRREGEVLEVTRQGYRMNGRVLRPAQVVVQAGSNDGAHGSPPNEDKEA